MLTSKDLQKTDKFYLVLQDSIVKSWYQYGVPAHLPTSIIHGKNYGWCHLTGTISLALTHTDLPLLEHLVITGVKDCRKVQSNFLDL